jgi:hypothetical protein
MGDAFDRSSLRVDRNAFGRIDPDKSFQNAMPVRLVSAKPV